MPQKRSRPLRMLLPLAVLLALAVLWSGWWYAVFSTVKSRYAGQEERLAAQGATLSCAQQSWGGYPFRVEMTCEAPRLAFESNGQIVLASSTRLAALLQAYNPTHVIALLTGPTVLTPAAGNPVEITHVVATASARLAEEERIQISAAVPDLAAPGFGSAKSLTLHLRGGRTGKAEFAATAEMLAAGLPDGSKVMLDRADVEASVPAEVLLASNPLRRAAETGAALDVMRLDLKQGALSITAGGTVNLDSQGRLNGKMTASANDLDLLLERISTQFNLGPNDVSAVKAMLGVLKASGSKIDVVAKDGKLYWGLIKLGEIRPLLPPS